MIVVTHETTVWISVTGEDCFKGEPQYYAGIGKPNFPVPAIELDNLLAMPYMRLMPLVKSWLLEQDRM